MLWFSTNNPVSRDNIQTTSFRITNSLCANKGSFIRSTKSSNGISKSFIVSKTRSMRSQQTLMSACAYSDANLVKLVKWLWIQRSRGHLIESIMAVVCCVCERAHIIVVHNLNRKEYWEETNTYSFMKNQTFNGMSKSIMNCERGSEFIQSSPHYHSSAPHVEDGYW